MDDRGQSLFGPRHRLVTIAILGLVAVNAFDGIAVVAALPAIGADLGRVGALTWVVTAYLVTSAIAVVAAGQVIDWVGPRTSFRVTVVLYCAASVGCALAPGFEALVVLRGLQGVGGGFVLAITLATIGLAYPEELRPRAIAANSLVWGSASLVGPAAAAFLVTTVGWRGVFACSIAIGLVAGLVGWRSLPRGESERARHLPFRAGSLVLLGGLVVVVVVGLSDLSSVSLAALALALVLATWYWRRASHAPGAVLERRYVRTMPFAAINIASAACFGGALGLSSYLPVYLRAALGASTATAAFSALYLSLGWTLGSVAGSRIVGRVRNDTLALAGSVLMAACLLASMLITGPDTPMPALFVLFLGCGVGIGLVSLSLLTLLQSSARSGEIGRATAAYQFARTLGYSCGAALTGGLVLFVVAGSIGDLQRVRPLLAGAAGVDAGARAAVASGFRAAHLGALALVLAGVVAAALLRRWPAGAPPRA